MGAFIRRHAVVILFVIVVVALALGFRRVENINARTRDLAEHNRALTHQLEATVKQRRIEICAAETETRQAVRTLLLGIADDFGPERAALYELRINEALGQPPDNCS